MKITLPIPPNPDDISYKQNPLAYQRAIYNWMSVVKGKVENASAINDSPLDTPFIVSSFTTNTHLAGTSTGTDVSNFLCTLLSSLGRKGVTSTNTLS